MAGEQKILIVDDELPVCKSIASVLEDQGYSITTALSGEEALKKQESTEPDIIIADLMMPGISGMDLLKTVKERRPETIVIMVTGYPSIASAVQAIKLGAFDYIPKPFTPEELRSLVSRAVERKNLGKEIGAQEVQEGARAEISIPKGLYCIPENSWAKVEENGTVRIGAHHVLMRTIGNVTSIEFPKENDMRYQGEACLRIIDSHNRIHRLWTPVTGRVIAVNEKLKQDFLKLMEDPYNEGWLVIINPLHVDKDLQNLALVEP